ncbi:MAG: carboxymuconolactone decarboxylase family protein [Planctomycetota bacterium]
MEPRPSSSDLPPTFRAFTARHPALAKAHRDVAQAVEEAGPLDGRIRALVKMGLCQGAGLETAFRRHVGHALDRGASSEEIEQAVLLGMNAVGFPRTVAAWKWAREEITARAR